MILDIKINNCFAFNEEVNLSLRADMRTKKFSSNVYKLNNVSILKSIGIYGSNNTGKTCLVKAISSFKQILLNKGKNLVSNIFNDNDICNLAMTFLEDNKIFNYEIKYDSEKKEYLYEKFMEITHDIHKNPTENIYFIKDIINESFESSDEDLKKTMSFSSKDNILIYSINVEKIKLLNYVKNVLTRFANKIEVISMENINFYGLSKTASIIKNNDVNKNSVINFIKNADLYLDDLKYNANLNFPDEYKQLEEFNEISEQLKLVSVYKGKEMPSYKFDSLGTKKISALAGYLVEAIKENRILVIDEIDSSIHFKLTRAIVSLFNNDLNKKAQMIFTTHDINLMDIKTLLRKEQIWFTHKDNTRTYLYSLSDFTAEKDGIRDTSDIIDKYTKGFFGAIPDPKLIDSLIELINE